MSKEDLTTQNSAPKRVPQHVAKTLSGGDNTVELKVEVSDNDGVENFAFTFGGVPVFVPTPKGVGVFHAVRGGPSKRLQWVMWGEAGGTMKVTVSRAGRVIRQRDASQIVPPRVVGYDYFNIEVA